jgi:hypothetical protein
LTKIGKINRKGSKRRKNESETVGTNDEGEEVLTEEGDTITIKISEWQPMIQILRDVFIEIKGVIGRLQLISKKDPELK